MGFRAKPSPAGRRVVSTRGSPRSGEDQLRPPSLFVVCLAVFVDMMGFGIILPLLPFHVEALGGSGLWVGALLTVYSAAQFVASPVLGSLSDRYGRRRLLLASLAGSAVSLGLSGVATNLMALLLARTWPGPAAGRSRSPRPTPSTCPGPKTRIRALGAVGALDRAGVRGRPGDRGRPGRRRRRVRRRLLPGAALAGDQRRARAVPARPRSTGRRAGEPGRAAERGLPARSGDQPRPALGPAVDGPGWWPSPAGP